MADALPDHLRHFARELPDGCWEWTGRRTPRGYGVYQPGTKRQGFAHRLAFESAFGPIPPGLYVMHTCDRPWCVRPSHLRAGTQADNMADMRAKGRAVNPQAAKTACKRGHEFTPENTMRQARGRLCRACWGPDGIMRKPR